MGKKEERGKGGLNREGEHAWHGRLDIRGRVGQPFYMGRGETAREKESLAICNVACALAVVRVRARIRVHTELKKLFASVFHLLFMVHSIPSSPLSRKKDRKKVKSS